MCGLVGVIGSKMTAVDNKVFKQLLYVDALRGTHSTSVTAMSREGTVEYYKRALNAADFMQLKEANRIASTMVSPFLMGHNRYATTGAINDDGAHPFQSGNVTLCHNGTLTDVSDLRDNTSFIIDSENIAFDMADRDNIEETIKNLHGAFALTWYNDHEGVFYIVRNIQRSLFIAKKLNCDTYYYASEKAMLDLVLQRNNISYEVEEVKVGHLYEFDVFNDKIKPKIKQVELSKPKPLPAPIFSPKTYKAPQFDIGVKITDEIEFYSEGLPTLNPESKGKGILLGETFDADQLKVKAYQQPDFSLAGFYTGKVQAIHNVQGEPCIIVGKVKLLDVLATDPKNQGKLKNLDEYIKAHSCNNVEVYYD